MTGGGVRLIGPVDWAGWLGRLNRPVSPTPSGLRHVCRSRIVVKVRVKATPWTTRSAGRGYSHRAASSLGFLETQLWARPRGFFFLSPFSLVQRLLHLLFLLLFLILFLFFLLVSFFFLLSFLLSFLFSFLVFLPVPPPRLFLSLFLSASALLEQPELFQSSFRVVLDQFLKALAWISITFQLYLNYIWIIFGLRATFN